LVAIYQTLVGGKCIVTTNPVAKHLNKFNRPKRIEDKRYKQRLKEMEKDIREVRRMQKDIYGK
jgi:hypothetical protein